MSGPLQKIRMRHEDQPKACPVCLEASIETTMEASMDVLLEPHTDEAAKHIQYDVEWTVVNAWLDCGHQVIKDGVPS